MRAARLVTALAVAGGCMLPAAVPAAAAIPVVDCSQTATRVTVTASVVLDPTCTYTGGFDIVASHVVFDCRGALVANDGSAGGNAGITVTTPADTDLDGVTIRSCRVDGYLNDVRIVRARFQALAIGHQYDHHLRGVTVEDSTLTGSLSVRVR